jgi:hypothetical protein
MAGFNYEEAREMTVTRAKAKAEIAIHDCEGGFGAFLEEVGDRAEYQGKEVLDWLGY